MQELPPNATPITTEDLLQTIGELYVQSRILQRIVANQSQQLVNGVTKEEKFDAIKS
ncbi:MAG TPA: hypothetical protein VGE97_09715 [Nitrososphaera sp.]